MGLFASAEASKNFAIGCAFFGVAAVAGCALAITNINKKPEQVSVSNEETVEVPATSSVDWLKIETVETTEAEGKKSAEIAAVQLNSQQVNTNSGVSANSNTTTSPSGSTTENGITNNPTPSNEEPEQTEDYLLELDLHEDGVVYMQDVTYEMIDEMTEETMTVVDRRTGYSYEVFKSYPGSRWGNQTLYMTTDLKLGSTEKPMLLTPKNTNIVSNYVLPASTEVKEYNEENPIEESINIDGDTYLYSPAAALAGTQLEDFGDNIVIYNSASSICPAGWRLLMNSEDYDYSDGQTETDFGSEISNMLYYEVDKTNNWDLPAIPYASSTLRIGDMSSYTLSGYKDYPLNSSSIMHVRCIYGETNMVRTNLTIDFNGATIDVDNWNGVKKITKVDHYKTWKSEFILPSFWIRRDGYKFMGYSTNKDAADPEYYDDGTEDHYIKLSDVMTGDTTIYAIWKKMRTITLDGNGGSNWQGDSWVITFDEDGSILNGGYDEPHWENHRFLGWALTPDATEVEYVYYDSNNELPTIWSVTGDVTFYAVWETYE